MKPSICYYYVTLRCNSKCTFCSIWSNKNNFHLKEQDIISVEHNLNALKIIGVRYIDFTGGEPLLSTNLIEILRLAKKYGFYTTITTNCILYPQYAEKLKGLVNVLEFSFESVDEKKHNAIRGINSYQKVLESIDIAKKTRQKFFLLHTVTNENAKDIQSLIKFAQTKKIVLVLNPVFEYFNNKPLSQKTTLEIIKYSKQPFVVCNTAILHLILNGGNNITKPVCKAVSSVIVISPDNHLILPCFHKQMKKIKINNNLAHIYKSQEVRDVEKKQGRFGFCDHCTINCYMQPSLYRSFSKYFFYSSMYSLKWLREYLR